MKTFSGSSLMVDEGCLRIYRTPLVYAYVSVNKQNWTLSLFPMHLVSDYARRVMYKLRPTIGPMPSL